MLTSSVGKTGKVAQAFSLPCPDSSGHSCERGITLLEMIVVVSIIALMVGLSFPSITAGLDSVRMSSATGSVAAFLNSAVTHAQRRQQSVAFVISPKDGLLSQYSNEAEFRREYKLPDGIVIEAPEEAKTFVLMPGGGHNSLWVDHEGHNEAKLFAEHGIASFVLKYRLAREKDSTYTIEGHALADAQRAIRLIRSKAKEWDIDPDRIGVMGFSAGGEIAALAATRFDNGNPNAADPIDRLGSKPAFQALIYPAIPQGMQLSKDTPPAFLACGENDRQNISQGLPELYVQLKKAGASAELHVYRGVGHGFGLRPTLKGPVSAWPTRFIEWLAALPASSQTPKAPGGGE
jgi:endo-1,4-beta-xylanase